MSLLSLQDVEVSFGAEDIIRGVTCDVNIGDRIGLIGRNGAGKTTLLQVLAGEMTATGGKRQIARNTRIALVQQIQAEPTTQATVEDEALAALQHLVNLERDLAEAAHALSSGEEGAVEAYAALHERLETERGFNYRARLTDVLTGLGLPKTEWQKPVAVLSGGQRSRLALAKALLAEPSLLLMDEPTNHLDLDALQWLDGFLARWPGTLVVTSHDRYFLDRVATQIWLMTGGRLTTYKGNYTKSEAQRQADLERQQRQFEAQQEYIAKEQDFIRRYGAGQRAREAQGRQKRLARLERIEAPKKEGSTSIAFKAKRSGDLVLGTKALAAGYGTKAIVEVQDLEVIRGDRVALIGPNGAGKTTLLRTIAGEMPVVAGRARLGANVHLAHYWQEAEDLDSTGIVLDELLRLPNMQLQEARNILGAFLFSGDDVFKSITALSGGERSRLALAKLVQAESNLLLLDEPTNHLDIPSRESLEAALRSYGGTLIFASHDRRLIAEIATRLWVIRDGRLTSFDGSFEAYLESRDMPPAPVRPAQPPPKPQRTNRDKENAAMVLRLEAEIAAAESELLVIGEAINAASARGDLVEIEALGLRFNDTQARLDTLTSTWLEVSS